MYKFLIHSLKSFKNIANRHLIKYGLVTNTVISVALRGLGDNIQQNIELDRIRFKVQTENDQNLKEKRYDLNRTMNISLSGLVLGPLSYHWYKYLDTILPTKTFNSILKKILLDQFVGATVFIFLFIMIISLLEGKDYSQSFNEFLVKFPFIYLVDWIIWPPSQALNFYLIPKEFRVVFVNLILVCWNVFLSFAQYDANY